MGPKRRGLTAMRATRGNSRVRHKVEGEGNRGHETFLWFLWKWKEWKRQSK